MAGIKRKSVVPSGSETKIKSKKVKVDAPAEKRSTKHESTKPPKSTKKSKKPKDESDELVESDTSEDDTGFYGFSANKNAATSSSEGLDDDESEPATTKVKPRAKAEKSNKWEKADGKKSYKEVASAEKQSSALAGLNGRCSW
jgi:pumilio family protein 6